MNEPKKAILRHSFPENAENLVDFIFSRMEFGDIAEVFSEEEIWKSERF